MTVSQFIAAIAAFTIPLMSLANTPAPLEVIEVTAQKRVQSLQTIAVAVTAINEAQLTQMQITDASQVAEQVPNLNVTRSIGGAYNYFIRGVGMDDFNLASIPAVGIYVDDVAIQNPMLANFSLLDIERVEVLRGPQNTLYGKNTTGGAINFIGRAPLPGQDTESRITLEAGNDGLLRFKGSHFVSLSDDTAVGLAYLSRQQDGLVSGTVVDDLNNNGDFNDTDRQAFKLRLGSKLSANLNLSASLYAGTQRQTAEVKTLLVGDADTGLIDLDDFQLDQVQSTLLAPRNNADLLGGYVKFQWQHNGYQITSISAFEDVDNERADDWGSQTLPSNIYQVLTYNSADTLSWSQELQLLSPVTDNGNWLLGALINKEQGDILQLAYIDPAGPGRPDDAIDDAGIGPLFDRGSWVEVNTLTVSLYGQMEVQLHQDWRLTTGLRWSTQALNPDVHSAGMLMDSAQMPFPLGSFGWYSLGNNGFDIQQDYAGFSVAENFKAANGGFPATAKIDERYTEWGGKVALSYSPSPDLMLYSSLARGFKMGAVNSNPTTAAFQALLNSTVTPETLTTWEAGFKSEWLDRYMRINGAVFYNDWQDYQFFLVYNPGSPDKLFASLVNLPEARTVGMELELSAILSDTMMLTLGIGYLDAKVRDGNLDVARIQPDLQQGFQNSVLSGDRLPNAPEWVFNLALEKSINWSHGALQLAVSYEFKDVHIHALAGNNNATWQHNFSEAAVDLINVSAQYTPNAVADLSVQLWARNLTDEQYCSERATIPGSSTDSVRLCAQGAFREIGLGLTYAF